MRDLSSTPLNAAWETTVAMPTIPPVVVETLTIFGKASLLIYLAAIAFGIWPYFSNRSGLNPVQTTLAFCILQCVVGILYSVLIIKNVNQSWTVTLSSIAVIITIIFYSKFRWGHISTGTNWHYLGLGVILSFGGLMCLAQAFTITPARQWPILMVFLTVIQVMVNMGIYYAFNRKQISVVSMIGFMGVLIFLPMIFVKKH